MNKQLIWNYDTFLCLTLDVIVSLIGNMYVYVNDYIPISRLDTLLILRLSERHYLTVLNIPWSMKVKYKTKLLF